MTAIDQHLLKVRSPIDGKEIPYHVSAPNPLPKTPIPVVFLLHDTLEDPSPAAFIEEAFRSAAEWSAVLSDGPPGLLVQPWGRGNASWFGPAGRALFDVWNQLQDQFLIPSSAVLFGTGSGGTGAIQLAAKFSRRFHAVAAVNPWTDDQLLLPFGIDDHPSWEADARRMVHPVDLAEKLVGKTIALANVPGRNDFSAIAAKRHFGLVTEALGRNGVEWRDFSVKANLFSEAPAAIDLAAIWKMLVATNDDKTSSPGRLTYPNSLFWRPLSIVVGTLGETSENGLMQSLAERIRSRWLSGEESSNIAPGDRRLIQEIPIVSDSEAVAETPEGDLVVLGSPRLNLLAAKWADRLPATWPSNESDEFAILGRTFANHSAFAVAKSARPDGEDGNVWIVAAGSEDAWVDVDRVRFSFLPDVFVQPKPGEILWMNHQGE